MHVGSISVSGIPNYKTVWVKNFLVPLRGKGQFAKVEQQQHMVRNLRGSSLQLRKPNGTVYASGNIPIG